MDLVVVLLGITREAKAVREHYWRPHLRNLHANKVFRGDEKTFMFDLFEMPNFVHNNKSISQEYENFVLSKGEFDEHIFLGEKSHQEIGTPSKSSAARNTPFEARSGFYVFENEIQNIRAGPKCLEIWRDILRRLPLSLHPLLSREEIIYQKKTRSEKKIFTHCFRHFL